MARGLQPSQLSIAVARAGEVFSAASVTGEGGAAVVAATSKLVELCELAGESTPALLDKYTKGADVLAQNQRDIHSARKAAAGSGTEDEPSQQEPPERQGPEPLPLVQDSLHAIGLLSRRRSDKEAQSFVRQELDADIFRENEALRSRHGLARREVILSSYRCVLH